MAKQAETNFKERVQRDLKTLPSTWFVKTQMRSVRGIPDILGCVNGYFFALELKKSAKENPDKLQQWVLEEIAEAGGFSIVTHPDNWDSVFEMLTDLAMEENTND